LTTGGVKSAKTGILSTLPDQDTNDSTRTYFQLVHDTIIGHYRIIEKIGAGGMGEVYLAEDTKLDRKVALKFLPQHLCQIADCRARFTREAQAAAKLDHPNIVAVHEVGEYNGRPFFSMQHVEGLTLKDVIAGKPLSMDRIIEIGSQVCEGLQAAHEKGITHRDIKPSNILIDSHGRARIVDFGLASVLGTDQLTKTGSTLGTIGYMSPEQVRGEKVDQRTDLFSFGVVLYEMITGHSPFKADSEAATLHAITNTKPDLLARFRREVPSEIQTIIDKALEKDVATRYQHADEMVADLLRIHQETSAQRLGLAAGNRGKRPKTLIHALVAVVVVSVGVIAALLLFQGKESRVTAPGIRKITNTGDVWYGVVSPDGASYAYSRITDPDRLRMTVYVSDFGGGQAIPVFEARYVQSICWSRDGKELLVRGREIGDTTSVAVFLIPRLGGQARKYNIPGRRPDGRGWDLAWLPDGERFVTIPDNNRFIFVDKESGDTTVVPIAEEFLDVWICGGFSPDGHWLAFAGDKEKKSELWLFSTKDNSLHVLYNDPLISDADWSPSGDAIYTIQMSIASNGNRLLRLNVDPRSGELRGEPEVLLSSLPYTVGVSVSGDGKKLLCRQFYHTGNIGQVFFQSGKDPATRQRKQLTEGTGYACAPAISPDGKLLTYMVEVGAELHAFIRTIDTDETTELTHSGFGVSSRWSPDGRHIALLVTDNPDQFVTSSVHIVNRDGTVARAPIPLATGDVIDPYMDWLAADRIVVYHDNRLSFTNPETGDTSSWAYGELADKVRCPRLSPNQRWLAVSPGNDILLLSVADRTEKLLYQATNPFVFGWDQDAKWVYFMEIHGLIARVNVESKKVDTLAIVPRLDWNIQGNSAAISADGTFAVYEIRQAYRDLYLIENFDPHVK
jgi:WD40 repeat protein